MTRALALSALLWLLAAPAHGILCITPTFTITPTVTATPTIGTPTASGTATATSTPIQTPTGPTATITQTPTITSTPGATSTSRSASFTPQAGADMASVFSGGTQTLNCVPSNSHGANEVLCGIRWNTAALAGCTVFDSITLTLERNQASLQSKDHYGFTIGWYADTGSPWAASDYQAAYDSTAYVNPTDIAALFPVPNGSTTLALVNGAGNVNTAGYTAVRMWLKADTAPTGKNYVSFGFGFLPHLSITCH